MSWMAAVFPTLRTTPPTAPESDTTTARGARVPRAARRPLIGGQLYLEALTAADDRCECSAWCGQRHRGRQGRCARRHDAESPLHVIPGNPDTDVRRVVDVDQVLVVCRACHDRRVTSERDQQAGQDRVRGRW